MPGTDIIKILEAAFREHARRPALSDYFKRKVRFTYLDTAAEIARLHLLLDKAGIRPGDRVALVGRENPRWCIAWLAVVSYGAVVVPISQEVDAGEILRVVKHSGSRLLVTDDGWWELLGPEFAGSVEAVFSLTDFHCFWEREGHALSKFQKETARHFREAYPKGFSAGDIKYADLPSDRVAMIACTSGTTARSKEVMLTAANLGAVVGFVLGDASAGSARDGVAKGDSAQSGREGQYYPSSRVLPLLPLAHLRGCVFDFLSPLAAGAHVILTGRTLPAKQILEALHHVRPDMVRTDPRVVEEICRRQLFPLLDRGATGFALRFPFARPAAYARIRKKMLKVFGGHVRQVVVGGANLSGDVEELLMRIKFPITVAYGLTEASSLVSLAPWREFKPGSVGRVLGGLVEVRIASPDPASVPGEIMVRGAGVMAGYYGDEAVTRDVLSPDGWLGTGDIGTMEADGTLYVMGRVRTAIAATEGPKSSGDFDGSGSAVSGDGPGGPKIYPEQIEARLESLPLVRESLVLEREGGRLTAMVHPDYEAAAAEKIPHEAIPEIMDRNLAELNATLAPHEQVAGIVIHPAAFEKTSKKTIRRYLYQL